jgi:hypothetical protein
VLLFICGLATADQPGVRDLIRECQIDVMVGLAQGSQAVNKAGHRSVLLGNLTQTLSHSFAKTGGLPGTQELHVLTCTPYTRPGMRAHFACLARPYASTKKIGNWSRHSHMTKDTNQGGLSRTAGARCNKDSEHSLPSTMQCFTIVERGASLQA